MYTRASASDYDDFQAKGWKTEELIPLMKKHETYQRSCLNRDIHGFEGPIKVSCKSRKLPRYPEASMLTNDSRKLYISRHARLPSGS